jgi:uncharacterized repeat protein (TIGR03803 family)
MCVGKGSLSMCAGLAILAAPLLSARPAAAGTLTVLASGVTGTPAVAAVSGTTVYGAALYGGALGAGTLFSVTAAGKVTTLYGFDPMSLGSGTSPGEVLAVDSAADLYGTALGGGPNGGGFVFELTAAGKFNILHAFGKGSDGAAPKEGLIRTANGTLYGTTAGGGTGDSGTVFSISATGAYSVLYRFANGKDGHHPTSSVSVDGKGNLYGTTLGNGSGGAPTGTVWKLSPSKVLTTLYTFKDGADGEYPSDAPTLDAAGNLYGTTRVKSGKPYAGAVWKIDAKGNFSVVHQFTGGADGSTPDGPLMLDTDGNLYGTTLAGGAKTGKGFGVLYRISAAGAFSVAYTFTGLVGGAGPTGMLAHDAKGAIYGGMTSGMVYKFVP